MKITELKNAIMKILHEKKFVSNFEIKLYHPFMENIKIEGYKQYTGTYPSDFECELQRVIDGICFKIVDGTYSDDEYDFSISGHVEYTYDNRIEDENSDYFTRVELK